MKDDNSVKKTNQLFNPNEPLFDASGDPIGADRILKYHELIKTCILIIFPKGYCREARRSFECLYNEGIIHTIKALRKFNRHEAISRVTKDSKRKRKSDSDHKKWKEENPLEALAVVEKGWVKKKLISEYRRLRHDYSEKELGGSSVPYDWNKIQADCQSSDMADNGSSYSFGWQSKEAQLSMNDFGTSKEMIVVNFDQVMADLEAMVKIQAESKDLGKVKEFFVGLPKERREDLKEYYFWGHDQETVRENALAAFFMNEETRLDASGGVEVVGGAGTPDFDDDDSGGYDN